jgi:hypothetical protein
MFSKIRLFVNLFFTRDTGKVSKNGFSSSFAIGKIVFLLLLSHPSFQFGSRKMGSKTIFHIIPQKQVNMRFRIPRMLLTFHYGGIWDLLLDFKGPVRANNRLKYCILALILNGVRIWTN